MMKPIKMKPCFKQYIWGGDKLRTVYGKDTPESPVAESWEISAHPDGLSMADGGEYDKMTIPELCEKYGKEFYGASMADGEPFPLLLKILDADDRLSVQVHPNDEYASKHENGGKGKTEAWYILHAEEGASLIYGFADSITPEEFRAAIEEGRCEEVLNHVPCNAGDVFYIPSGTVHAVGKGLMIAEIQQSSNTTYRVYDYDRRDAAGNLRELHIEKALAVSNTASSRGSEKCVAKAEKIEGGTIKHIINNEFFCFDELNISGKSVLDTSGLLHLLLVADGEMSVGGLKLKKGDSALVPACVGEYAVEGEGCLLLYYTQSKN